MLAYFLHFCGWPLGTSTSWSGIYVNTSGRYLSFFSNTTRRHDVVVYRLLRLCQVVPCFFFVFFIVGTVFPQVADNRAMYTSLSST